MTQLFVIERDFTGFSDIDRDAATFRAKICAMYFERMRWIRSFYDEAAEKSRCLYEADSAKDLQLHAYASVVSCTEVRPVEEIFPQNELDLEQAHVSPLRDEKGSTPLWLVRIGVEGSMESGPIVDLARSVPGVKRAFWDVEIRELMVVFKSASKPALLMGEGASVIDIREVSEVMPSDIEVPTASS